MRPHTKNANEWGTLDGGQECPPYIGEQTKKQAAHKWGSLVWRNPPGRRETLQGRRRIVGRCRCGRSVRRLRWCCAGGVRHQVHIHPAILLPAFGSLVRLNRLILAEADQINLVGRDLLLRRQVLNDRVGAALAEVVV